MILSFKQWLAEALEIPDTKYGYWINNDGKAFSVDGFDHNGVFRKLSSRGEAPEINEYDGAYGTAYKNGWIRVVAYTSGGSLELQFNSRYVTKRALRTCLAIAKEREIVALFVEFANISEIELGPVHGHNNAIRAINQLIIKAHFKVPTMKPSIGRDGFPPSTAGARI